ncbi:MAG TPA: TonB-dependent receptor [Bryobacteraceae bacterium]|nr:TonB-dependent receptor [Bryobacteraceae bacterium]
MAAETPASVSALDTGQIQRTPGDNLDDRLRMVPGFSLFRRSSSLVAHPTTQGISLRGIGSSGASRSLVLWDGIPANDPFGGWVYWTQFQPEEIDRVEVSRGASTSVFGDRTLGGAVAIFSRPPQRYLLHGEYQGGARGTHDLSAGFSHLFSRFGMSIDSRAFTTDGYFIVPESIRGPIDRKAGLDFVTGSVRLDYLGSAHRLFFKTSILAEDRRNGTILQNNSTGMGTISLHYQAQRGRDTFSALAFRTQESFHSAFSAISADRRTETLSYRQTVPSNGTGGAGFWSHNTRDWNLLGGADFFRVEGTSTDSLVPTGKRVGGGDQFQHGVFAQADASWKSLKLFGGLRHQFTGQDSTFLSPSAGLVAGRGRLRARGSVYRSFRAPTLNELFRVFRTGNVQTNANPLLRPETLFGAEAGLDLVGEASRLRLTFFRNSIADLVSNITISTTPALITRQRANAASALGRGAEFNAMQRLGAFTGELSYLFVDSRYGTGARIPQVARHQGSGQLTFQKHDTLASVGLKSFSYAFDDDLNTPRFLLPGFAVLQFMVRQRITPQLTALASFDNILDRRYYTQFSPNANIGAPRLWRLGLRWEGRVR